MHRGGNGLTVAYRFLADGSVSVHDERWLTYPWGVRGGQPGLRSTKRLVRSDGSEQWLPSKSEGINVKKGDLLYFNTWGGGGWGDPYDRDPELVRADVARGLVSAQGARRYGVVLSENSSIDQDATRTLRESLSNERGEVELFDFGGSIEEIKARCKEETHLDPPQAPTFSMQGG